jgi:hypothetical protein
MAQDSCFGFAPPKCQALDFLGDFQRPSGYTTVLDVLVSQFELLMALQKADMEQLWNYHSGHDIRSSSLRDCSGRWIIQMKPLLLRTICTF